MINWFEERLTIYLSARRWRRGAGKPPSPEKAREMAEAARARYGAVTTRKPE